VGAPSLSVSWYILTEAPSSVDFVDGFEKNENFLPSESLAVTLINFPI
jgi:hypothetical protein